MTGDLKNRSAQQVGPEEQIGRLGIVAGGGRLPYEVLCALSASGFSPKLIAIDGEADISLLTPFQPDVRHWGQIGAMIKAFQEAQCTSLLLIGGISRRPDFARIAGDFETVKRLPKIIKAVVGGDDGVLRGVIRMIEDEGFTVVGVREVAPSLLMPEGTISASKPNQQDLNDIKQASDAGAVLGPLDIGQGVVCINGRIVAVEGAEGTDRLLERTRDMRQEKRFSAKGRVGVLVKRSKPGQDLRVDLPTIGPLTVQLAFDAGLRGVALEAQHCLVAERERTIELAKELGLFLVGQTFVTPEKIG